MIFFLTKKARKVTKSAKNSTTKNCKKNAISAEKGQQVGFHSIGATIRTRQESWCLPYAGFFVFEKQISKAYLFYYLYSGAKVETSPQKMANIMNEFYVKKVAGIPVLHDSMGGNRLDCFSGGKRVGEMYGFIYTWLFRWESVGLV